MLLQSCQNTPYTIYMAIIMPQKSYLHKEPIFRTTACARLYHSSSRHKGRSFVTRITPGINLIQYQLTEQVDGLYNLVTSAKVFVRVATSPIAARKIYQSNLED